MHYKARVNELEEKLRQLKRSRLTVEQERLAILRDAALVFTTLGSAGSERLRRSWSDLVIIHKAHAATEARTLLALHHSTRYVLFGTRGSSSPS